MLTGHPPVSCWSSLTRSAIAHRACLPCWHRVQDEDGPCGQGGIAQQWPRHGIGTIPGRNTPGEAPGEQLEERIGHSESVGQQAGSIAGVGDGEDDQVAPGGGGQIGDNPRLCSQCFEGGFQPGEMRGWDGSQRASPSSHDRMVLSATPHMVARADSLAPADRRAACRAAPATVPTGPR